MCKRTYKKNNQVSVHFNNTNYSGNLPLNYILKGLLPCFLFENLITSNIGNLNYLKIKIIWSTKTCTGRAGEDKK